MAIFKMEVHVGFLLINLLQFSLHCGCTDVLLSTDSIFVRENSTLTFTCSTSSVGFVKFIEIFKSNTRLVRMGLINTGCTIATLVSPMSNCSCVNPNTYMCTTNHVTRLNNTDMWYCTDSVEGIATKSNIVSIDVRVPIAFVSIRPDPDKPMPVNEDDEMHLTCEAFNGIPAANITWFLNNKTKDFNGIISNSSRINVTENNDGTKTTKSTLTYTVRRSDHDKVVYCNASNEDNHEISSKTIRLNVRYFPEKLVYINGHESHDTYYMIRNSGTKQTLQCVVHDGRPLANLSWSCYNGTQTDMNTPSSAISNVSWFAGNWNDSSCTCKASHILGWSQSQSVAVEVLFEPSIITCKVGNASIHRGILNVTLSSNVTINCSSDGNPKPSNFTWILPSNNTFQGQLLSYRDIQTSLQGGYSLLVENVMKPSIGTTVKGYTNTTFDMHVQYHPSRPTLKFITKNTNTTTSSISVIKSEEISIACIADGNPTPSYTWSTGHEGQIITSTFEIDTNLRCEVSNMLYPTGDTSTYTQVYSSLKIVVLYSPDIPVLWTNTTCMNNFTIEDNVLRVLELKEIKVQCFAAGNPEPTCQWTNQSQSCTLDIPNATKDDIGTYYCNASNSFNTTYGTTVKGHNVSFLNLDILYPPKIINLTERVEVLEGGNLSLTCYAEPGNPSDTFLSWISTEQPERNTSDQYLTIQNISRTERGEFTCFALNIMHPTGCQERTGNDTKRVYVDVQYKASIKTFTSINSPVYHGDNINFFCDVDSYPPANITLVSPAGSTLVHIEGNNQLHYNKTSSCFEDIGLFTCKSKNKHNHMQHERSNVTVNVQCSPMYPADYNQISTIETRLGEKAVFNFSVFANPPPTNFTWTNISNSMQTLIYATLSERVFINTSNMSSAFIIKRVECWDAGNYSVMVENEVGNMTESFRLVVVEQSTTIGLSTINIAPNNQRNSNNTVAAVGGSVGAITSVVIIAVVVLVLFYRRMKNFKGTSQHNNNNFHPLQDTRRESKNMEMGSFDSILPINEETPKYEEEKNIYGNIQPKETFGKCLAIKTLRDTIRKLKFDPLQVFKEFYTLQMGLKYDTKTALKPNNVAKNRYRSVYPYEASRVVLPFLRGDTDSDYINASYVDGYSKPKKYIAAQGPLENTVSDTWRMIHSENIKIIVMVTNLIETVKRKCFKYWPDDRDTYGKCNVKLDQVEEYADFVVRHFTYSMEGTRFERQLIQFHFTSWPDKNVPATALSLVQFWRKVRQSEFVENTPWMVHCSAGVGRTGTFIALDYLYDQGKIDGKLNVPETVNVLREQRISMVQTKEQYLYLHEAIMELLDPIGQIFTPGNSLRLQSTATEESKLSKEFKAITNSIVNVKTDVEENDYDLKTIPDGLLPENISKSMDQTVIPDDLFRPLISTGNDFINAVYIPTYRDAEKYIVTQFPLQNTMIDFVRLLWYHNIQDVVLLDVGFEQRHCYWPNNKSPLGLGPFVISLVSVEEGKNCTTRRIDISLAEKRQSKQTVLHQFTAWPGYLNVCEPKTLTEFLQVISRIAGPVVIQCNDGFSRSGLFAAILCIVDRIKTDKEVAIADTVRLVKHRRQAAITDVQQYQFCHEVVFEYLKGREIHTEENENQDYVNMTFPKFQ